MMSKQEALASLVEIEKSLEATDSPIVLLSGILTVLLLWAVFSIGRARWESIDDQ